MALSEYKFVDTDTNTIVEDLVALYEELTGSTTAPASPERVFITWVADVIVQLREMINYAANQNIPSRADGENLDALAELFYQKSRPEASPAQVTMRFYLSEAQPDSVIIVKGTRVSDQANTYFWETAEDLEIPAGEISGDVAATCQTYGTEGNGWVPGQITQLVDLFAYYESCENITESDGGSDELSDDEFAALLRLSEDAYTTAGATGAYIYWAKTASSQISDVLAIQPIIQRDETVTVYDHHAFIGGYDLSEDTLEVYANGQLLTWGADYQYTYEDSLLTIELLASGSAYGATELEISIRDILAGQVWIYALMEDGSLPSEEVKSMILTACNADEVRPLTDLVSVHDADLVECEVDVTYYLYRNTEKSAAEIAEEVEVAAQEYVDWQTGKLGRDINPSYLTSLLMATGIKRVEVNSPEYRWLSDGSDHKAPELAQVTSVTIHNGGYEDV